MNFISSEEKSFPAHLNEQCIHQLFEEQVERCPEAIAVSFQTHMLTYSYLHTQVSQLACYLQSLGVAPEIRVGLCVERSPEMIVGLLAILKAGGVYVPLDPNYPQKRLSFMIADAQLAIVLTQPHLQQHFAPYGVTQVILHSYKTSTWLPELSPASSISTSAIRTLTPSNAAYVIYTSGSTGRPKGVVIEHHSLCTMICSQVQQFAIAPDHRVLQFASLSFDASISEIFMALSSGATLVLQPKAFTLLDTSLPAFLYEQAITTITLPPSVLAAYQPSAELAALHTLIVAGEACALDVLARWGTERTVFNAYGPTEATVCCSAATWKPGISARCIGHPLAHMHLYILDESLQPVSVGTIGELYISGPCLARGYLGQPALTAERFIPLPFHDEDGARCYKSGDLVRCLPDGTLEFVGRVDQQVKLRGFRIELGEIEALLAQHPLIREAVVLLDEEENGDQRLLAYLTQHPMALSSSPFELQSYLKQLVPDYMIPTHFAYLVSFPLTPTGKVDRQALQAMQIGQEDDDLEVVAPRTYVEEVLASIWIEVLSMTEEEPISIHDNFFELGGHSLNAIRLISQIQEHLEVGLEIIQIVTSPTIAELAKLIEAKQGDATSAPSST